MRTRFVSRACAPHALCGRPFPVCRNNHDVRLARVVTGRSGVRQGQSTRRTPLGFDRHWNRYWVLGGTDDGGSPRLFVERMTPAQQGEVGLVSCAVTCRTFPHASHPPTYAICPRKLILTSSLQAHMKTSCMPRWADGFILVLKQGNREKPHDQLASQEWGVYESLPAIDALIGFMNAHGAHARYNLLCWFRTAFILQKILSGWSKTRRCPALLTGAREGPLKKALQQVRRKLAAAPQPDTPPAQSAPTATADVSQPASAAEPNGAAAAAVDDSGVEPSAGGAATGTTADPETVNGTAEASAEAISNGPDRDGAAPDPSGAAHSRAAEANGAAVDDPPQTAGTAAPAENGDGPMAEAGAQPAGDVGAARAVDMDVDAGEAVQAGDGRPASAAGDMSTAGADVAAADQSPGVVTLRPAHVGTASQSVCCCTS